MINFFKAAQKLKVFLNKFTHPVFIFIILFCHAIFAQGKVESPIVAERLQLKNIEQLFKDAKFQEMLKACETSLVQYKQSLSFHYTCGLGYLYSETRSIGERNKNLGKAIRLFEESEYAFALNPRARTNHLNLLYHLGLAWQLSGNREMAIYTYKRLLVLDDRKLEAIYNLAVCFEQSGNTIEANRSFSRYLKIKIEGEEEF